MSSQAEGEPSKAKMKYDWYQTETDVVITILIKNVQDPQINYNDKSVSVNISQPTENSLNLDLAHKIQPDQCSYKVYGTKIEIKLKKLEGIRWSTLEAAIDSTTSSTAWQGANKWNLIEKQLTEEEKKDNTSEEALNKMFQEIYGKGSDEVKKAMNKSFLESGGTVLSTNWKDVGDGTVAVQPPDGMEFKKWD